MFLSNNSSTSHLNEISRLIELSEECILCTCWLDLEALDLIESFVEKESRLQKYKFTLMVERCMFRKRFECD